MVGLFIYYDEEGYSDGFKSQFALYTFPNFESAEKRFKEFINEWIDRMDDEDIDREKALNYAVSKYAFDSSEYCDWLYNYAKIEILVPNRVY